LEIKPNLYTSPHVSAPQASIEEQIHIRFLYNWDLKSLQCWSIMACGDMDPFFGRGLMIALWSWNM